MKLLNKRLIIIAFILLTLAAVIYLALPKTVAPTVIDTLPQKGATEVSESTQISINFNQDISESAKNGVSISVNPEVRFDSTWLTNTYKVIPKSDLQNNTTYSVGVFYNKKEIYDFSFRTATFAQKQIQQYGGLQSQMDYSFGQATKKVVQQYPWYTSLPIKTNDYVVYYDFQQQKFAITFLTTKTSDEQKTLIQEAIGKIQQTGAKPPVEYYINQP